MNIEDLRIGNWVSWKNDEWRVGEITKKGIVLEPPHGRDITVPLEELTGLELTPQWFHDLGFTYSNGVSWAVDKDYGRMSIEDADGLYEVSWYGNHLSTVEWVHELQNLWYAICGTELPAEELDMAEALTPKTDKRQIIF